MMSAVAARRKMAFSTLSRRMRLVLSMRDIVSTAQPLPKAGLSGKQPLPRWCRTGANWFIRKARIRKNRNFRPLEVAPPDRRGLLANSDSTFKRETCFTLPSVGPHTDGRWRSEVAARVPVIAGRVFEHGPESPSWSDPRGQVMKTPDDVAEMLRLKACGWG